MNRSKYIYSAILLAIGLLATGLPATAPTSAFAQGLPFEAEPPPLAVDDDGPAAEDIDAELLTEYPDAFVAPVFSSDSWFDDGCWEGFGQFSLLYRDDPRSVKLADDFSLSPIRTALVADDQEYRITPGMRIGMRRYLGRDYQNRDNVLEFSYMGLFEWERVSGASGIAPRSLFATGDASGLVGGFNRADFQRYQHEADLNSVELNMRWQWRPGRDQMIYHPDGTWSREMAEGTVPTLIAGLRYVKVDESFLWISRRFLPDFSALDPDYSGDYHVETNNDMFGPQIGVDYKRQTKWLDWGMRTKLAALVNFADQRTVVRINNDEENFFDDDDDPMTPDVPFDVVTADRNERVREEFVSVVMDASLYGAVKINPNVTFRAGYDTMLIYQIAVASDQVTFGDARVPNININGVAFYQGLSFRIEALY